MATSPVRRLGSTQIAGLLATLVLLLLHARVYAFLTDDAFISFRYARNLADGFGLVINPGLERVEGYTNFLWVVILAAFDAVGLAPERIVHVLTVLLTLGFWALVARRSVEDASPGEPVWLVGVPCLLLGATRSVAMWSTSGLETRLFELLIVAAVLRLVREIECGSSGSRKYFEDFSVSKKSFSYSERSGNSAAGQP